MDEAQRLITMQRRYALAAYPKGKWFKVERAGETYTVEATCRRCEGPVSGQGTTYVDARTATLHALVTHYEGHSTYNLHAALFGALANLVMYRG